MQLAMVETANWDGELVADFSPKRSRLRETKMVRLGRHSPANDAGLPCYEFAMLPVAEANGFSRDAPAAARGSDTKRSRPR
jgi:hypothetical protein